ncbi:Ig-like domain-containing protein [Aeromonas veronii]|uniref:Ig-like domain-containing protein n=1 Tax=Aeromonas veronii TaxID=654 RepID=UPI001FFFB942|nr:Ig-like domain-containing protein [Aeromonas veronii]UPK54825.1 Ig-like domain-containing protein [Aeromonas veronii]
MGETSEVTFSFSEKVTGFDEGSLTVVGGTSPISRAPTWQTWTGTFTPIPGLYRSASVTVNNGSYTDLNGNVGTGNSDGHRESTPRPRAWRSTLLTTC